METIRKLLDVIYKSFGIIIFSFVLLIIFAICYSIYKFTNDDSNVKESSLKVKKIDKSITDTNKTLKWEKNEYKDEMTDKVTKYNYIYDKKKSGGEIVFYSEGSVRLFLPKVNTCIHDLNLDSGCKAQYRINKNPIKTLKFYSEKNINEISRYIHEDYKKEFFEEIKNGGELIIQYNNYLDETKKVYFTIPKIDFEYKYN